VPFVEKQTTGEYLVVSHRDVYRPHRKLKGGPRTSFMVRYLGRPASLASGKKKEYIYPVVVLGRAQIMFPKELKGKRVRFKVEVVKLPELKK
jgi:hypothetical protein